MRQRTRTGKHAHPGLELNAFDELNPFPPHPVCCPTPGQRCDKCTLELRSPVPELLLGRAKDQLLNAFASAIDELAEKGQGKLGFTFHNRKFIDIPEKPQYSRAKGIKRITQKAKTWK